LSRFRLTFDLTRQTLYAEPGLNFQSPFKKNQAGLNLVFIKEHKVFWVAAVSPEGPAQQLDLKKGDIIIQVNGQSITEKNQKQLKQLFYGLAGEKLTLLKADGTLLNLVLKDYY